MYSKREKKHSHFRSAIVILLSFVMLVTWTVVPLNYTEASQSAGMGNDIATEKGTLNEDKDVYRVLIISPFVEWDGRATYRAKLNEYVTDRIWNAVLKDKPKNTQDIEQYKIDHIKIKSVSSREAVTLNCDLMTEYDYIYMGPGAGSDNTWDKYHHLGSETASAVSRRMYTSEQMNEWWPEGGTKKNDYHIYTMTPGNDLTAKLRDEIIEFYNAGYPVEFACKSDNVNKNSSYAAIMGTSVDGSPDTTNAAKLFDKIIGENNKADCSDTRADYVEEQIVTRLQNVKKKIYIDIQEKPIENQYANELNSNTKTLTYMFSIIDDSEAHKGKEATDTYSLEFITDNNYDGRYDVTKEKMEDVGLKDAENIYDKNIDANQLKTGKTYVLIINAAEYVGLFSWCIKIKKNPDTDKRYATATGYTKLRLGYEQQKEVIKVLQILPNHTGTTMYNRTFVYLPTKEEIQWFNTHSDPSFSDYSAAFPDTAAEMDTTLYTSNNDNKTQGINGVLKAMSRYAANISALSEYDIDIDRIRINQLRGSETQQESGLYSEEYLYSEINKYDMLVIGFADAYLDKAPTEANSVNDKLWNAVKRFIEVDGKAVLFTHDTSSPLGYDVNKVNYEAHKTTNGNEANTNKWYYGYNINKYFRNILGMDRFGVTLSQGDSRLADKDFIYNRHAYYNDSVQRYYDALGSVINLSEIAVSTDIVKWNVGEGVSVKSCVKYDGTLGSLLLKTQPVEYKETVEVENPSDDSTSGGETGNKTYEERTVTYTFDPSRPETFYESNITAAGMADYVTEWTTDISWIPGEVILEKPVYSQAHPDVGMLHTEYNMQGVNMQLSYYWSEYKIYGTAASNEPTTGGAIEATPSDITGGGTGNTEGSGTLTVIDEGSSHFIPDRSYNSEYMNVEMDSDGKPKKYYRYDNVQVPGHSMYYFSNLEKSTNTCYYRISNGKLKTFTKENTTGNERKAKKVVSIDNFNCNKDGYLMNQGYSDVTSRLWNESKSEFSGTNKVYRVNKGPITMYPNDLGETIEVASTHNQYFQLDMEDSEMVVWYTLTGADNPGSFKNGDPKYYKKGDGRNGYYIYNKGNITYSGAGHSPDVTSDEVALFVNTMVGAYRAADPGIKLQVTNWDAASTEKGDYVINLNHLLEQTIQQSTDANGNTSSTSTDNPSQTMYVQDIVSNENGQYLRLKFKFTDNTLASKKSLSLQIYDVTNKGVTEAVTNADIIKNNYDVLDYFAGSIYRSSDNYRVDRVTLNYDTYTVESNAIEAGVEYYIYVKLTGSNQVLMPVVTSSTISSGDLGKTINTNYSHLVTLNNRVWFDLD